MTKLDRNTQYQSPQSRTRFWWLAILTLAPIQLGGKGCEIGVVGDDSEVGGQAGTAATTGGAAATTGGAASSNPSVAGASSIGGSGASTTHPAVSVCGGLTGASCAVGQYCKYDLAAQCGAADQTGVCAAIPEACTLLYAPVCGCDGKTYGNDCSAAGAGVSVATNGECVGNPAPGASCGGLTGAGCAKGEFCNYPVEAQCGAADQTGTCATIPEACDMMYAPVCGCDGKTYGNACSAAGAGVSVVSNGECAAQPPDDPSCGGLQGRACAKGQYCNFPKEAQCGAADQTGTCATIPEACDMMYAPVCGCDGKTYGNACNAAGAGISVASDGACANG